MRSGQVSDSGWSRRFLRSRAAVRTSENYLKAWAPGGEKTGRSALWGARKSPYAQNHSLGLARLLCQLWQLWIGGTTWGLGDMKKGWHFTRVLSQGHLTACKVGCMCWHRRKEEPGSPALMPWFLACVGGSVLILF